MIQNAFGQDIPQIQDILKNKSIHVYVRQTLADVLQHVGVHNTSTVNDILSSAQHSTLINYEIAAHMALERCGATEKIPASLTDRAQLIYEQIKPYIIGQKILDYGCGDGKVGLLLAQDGKTVVLKDVYEHPNIRNIQLQGLEFFLITQDKPLPDPAEFYDTTLLLTVLHHSSHPLQTLEEAQRVTRKDGHIILIESVYGITDETKFGQLTHEEQRLTNIFFDHFYNRVLHYSANPATKVNVPFNFNTPDGWKHEFEVRGMTQVKVIYLGIDQKTVPEYHTLHIVRV
jgi:SAM-dependent methyltransferase